MTLGDAQQAQAAASYAAAGAKVGSIVPGIGTVIGAVVGAVVGWLSGKSKPVRASAEQVAQCKSLVGEYMGYAAQLPNKPIPLEWEQLSQLNWCLEALYASDVNRRDPRWFDIEFHEAMRPLAIQIVKKIYETPIGATVTLDAISAKDIKGRTLTFQGFSFVNKPFTDLKTFNDEYFFNVIVKICEDMTKNNGGRCPQYHGRPEWRRLAYDLLAWAARTTLPNISEEDLKAASAVAATIPNTSASNVVSAVEQIMGRTVQSGETAAALTTVTTPPTPAPAPPSTAPPVTLPTISSVTAPAAGDVSTLVAQLLAQGQSQTDAFNSAVAALQSQGKVVTPADKTAIAAQVEQAASPWYKQPALLATAGLALFFLAVPMLKKSRRA